MKKLADVLNPYCPFCHKAFVIPVGSASTRLKQCCCKKGKEYLKTYFDSQVKTWVTENNSTEPTEIFNDEDTNNG